MKQKGYGNVSINFVSFSNCFTKFTAELRIFKLLSLMANSRDFDKLIVFTFSKVDSLFKLW